ncbi:DUF6274 family protein [Streptomyces sp. NPDC054919]
MVASTARHETRALLRAHLAAASGYRHLTRHCPDLPSPPAARHGARRRLHGARHGLPRVRDGLRVRARP